MRTGSKSPAGSYDIKWRSHEPNRLETFSDAVFAFAVTLIIVSLEVPRSFDEFYETMKGTFSFGVCFAVLFNLWYTQNLYFRRFGLNDIRTVSLNAILLFVVLVFVYPLKFLAGLLFLGNFHTVHGHQQPVITIEHAPTLMLIYGTGYTVIHLIFTLLYLNVKSHKEILKLSDAEYFASRTEMFKNLISVLTGIVSMALAIALPVRISGLSGYFYCVLPIAYWIFLSLRGSQARRHFSQG